MPLPHAERRARQCVWQRYYKLRKRLGLAVPVRDLIPPGAYEAELRRRAERRRRENEAYARAALEAYRARAVRSAMEAGP